MPTATASASALQRWARARLASFEIQRESPPAVATLPSSVMAVFQVTSGRPVFACLRNGWFIIRAALATAPSTTSTRIPSSRSMPSPRPLAFSLGSSLATTTRASRASTIASVHGGVRPWWQHGSSDTYIVAPAGSAVHADRASRSACGMPAAAWKPSPMVRPSFTITAPTSGFGLVRPRASEPSSIALLRWRSSRSVASDSAIRTRPVSNIDSRVNFTSGANLRWLMRRSASTSHARIAAAVPAVEHDPAGATAGPAAPPAGARWRPSRPTGPAMVTGAILAAILGVGLYVRLRHNGYGLPYVYNYDEANHFVNHSVAMLQGPLDPGYYQNPSGFTYVIYLLLRVVYGVF